MSKASHFCDSIYGMKLLYVETCNHVNTALDQFWEINSCDYGETLGLFCDEYYSVMGFSASQEKDLLMELRAQTGKCSSVYEPEFAFKQ